MKCQCGNEFAIRLRVRYRNGEKQEYCDRCADLPNMSLPDVSDVKEPYHDEHLGAWVTSRRQKANLLKERGYREKRESKWKYIKNEKERYRYFRDKIGETGYE